MMGWSEGRRVAGLSSVVSISTGASAGRTLGFKEAMQVLACDAPHAILSVLVTPAVWAQGNETQGGSIGGRKRGRHHAS